MDELDQLLRSADPATGDRARAGGTAVREAALALVRDAPAARPRRRRRAGAIAAAAALLVLAPAGVAWATGALEGVLGTWLGRDSLTSAAVHEAPGGGACALGAWIGPSTEVGIDRDGDGRLDELEYSWTPGLVSLVGPGVEPSDVQEISFGVGGTDPGGADDYGAFVQADYDRFEAWALAQDWDADAADVVAGWDGTASLPGLLYDRITAEATAAGVLPSGSVVLMTTARCDADG